MPVSWPSDAPVHPQQCAAPKGPRPASPICDGAASTMEGPSRIPAQTSASSQHPLPLVGLPPPTELRGRWETKTFMIRPEDRTGKEE